MKQKKNKKTFALTFEQWWEIYGDEVQADLEKRVQENKLNQTEKEAKMVIKKNLNELIETLCELIDCKYNISIHSVSSREKLITFRIDEPGDHWYIDFYWR